MSEAEQLDLLDWLAAQPPCLPPPTPDPVSSPSSSDRIPVLLTRVDPSCNMHRFYSVALAASLFGESGVVRHWGRLGTSGQSRTGWYEEPREAESALRDLLRAKRRRGYTF